MSRKRIFDIALSVVLLPLVILVCGVVAIAYMLVERESPFFLQRRLGLNKKEFTLYKIRTMKADTANVATHNVSISSVTKLGTFLRATKLDELPQVWNVLIGDMSFVGPRPGLPIQIELTLERDHKNVYSIRPGITGPSQVKGIDMSNPVELALSDSEYLNYKSLRTDLKIIIATAFGAGYGDKVSKG